MPWVTAILGGLAFVATASSCASKTATEATPKRVRIRPVSAASFELVPEPHQYPYCLAYTVSSRGVLRLLSMSEANASIECPAGEPVGHHPFRVPASEPSVKILVLFTSQAVSATSVSQQLLETSNAATLKGMDLRLPGQAALEIVDFTIGGGVP